MSWIEELQTASYKGISFETKALGETGGKKGSEHDFPQRDGGSVEDLGNKIRSFSIEAFVSGDNYKTARDDLRSALESSGQGELIHPTHGSLTVLPTSWSISENIIEEGGFARFSITFLEIKSENVPEISLQKQTIATDLIGAASEQIGAAFSNSYKITSSAELAQSIADYARVTAIIDEHTLPILPDNLLPEYNQLKTVLNSNIGNWLQSDPLLVAKNYSKLISVVAKDIKNAIRTIKQQQKIIADIQIEFPSPDIKNRVKINQCAMSENVQCAVVAAICESANNFVYQNRVQAATIINTVLSIFASVQQNLNNIESLFNSELSEKKYIVNYDLSQLIDDIASSTAQSITDKSFTLASERKITLTEDRTPIELCFSLYGNLDNLDNLIDWNKINNPILIKSGSEVIYYS